MHDGNNATKMLFDLLLILSKYDYSYAEAKLITIYNRTDLYSSKALPSLQEYIVFLYPGFGLAVFESFVPGNAYYAFRYTEFEKLLNRVSSLTKTQMLMNSA